MSHSPSPQPPDPTPPRPSSCDMVFQTDIAWPAGLLTIFNLNHQRNGTFKNRYYGPYDKLLNYCFGGDDSFTYYVALQNPPTEDNHETVESIVFLVVLNQELQPVLIVEIKDDAWVQKAELRFRADKQLRDRYAIMLDECPLPRLWGLSLLGTSMRVYCGDTQTYDVTSAVVPRPEPLSRILPPSFLRGEWDMDILSPDGFAKMKEIVNDILENVNNN